MASSCVATAKLMLNSKSRRWPEGIANSSGQVGLNLCDHLLGQPSFPDNISDAQIAWMPRWQNLESPHKGKCVRGYSVYPTGGCGSFPWYYGQIEGYRARFKLDIKKYYATLVSFYCQCPSLRSDTNYVDIDPQVKDIYGTPVARIHFDWGPNELLTWEQAKDVCARVIKSAGGEVWGTGEHPNTPGCSLHETGTCRIGNDPRKFVTNRFGQTHDVPNLYICDASVFLNCTDKTTTLSILALSLRTCEYLMEQMRSARAS